MGLDAQVFCDCYESGRLRSFPRPEWGVVIAEDGSRCSTADDLDMDVEFDRWNTNACEHRDGVLMEFRLGNASLIGFLNACLQSFRDDYPVLLNRVLYSGTHAGDYVPASLLPELEREVARLAHIHVQATDDEEYIRGFQVQMEELVACALRVGKPIAF